jgi:hypothetical protein
MSFRKLRIAWSAPFVVAYVLLVALWVRSYFAADFVIVFIPEHHVVDVGSEYGVVRITAACFRNRKLEPSFTISSAENPSLGDYWGFDRRPDDLGHERVAIKFPHWFAMLLAPVMAALPWLRSGQLPKTERPME